MTDVKTRKETALERRLRADLEKPINARSLLAIGDRTVTRAVVTGATEPCATTGAVFFTLATDKGAFSLEVPALAVPSVAAVILAAVGEGKEGEASAAFLEASEETLALWKKNTWGEVSGLEAQRCAPSGAGDDGSEEDVQLVLCPQDGAYTEALVAVVAAPLARLLAARMNAVYVGMTEEEKCARVIRLGNIGGVVEVDAEKERPKLAEIQRQAAEAVARLRQAERIGQDGPVAEAGQAFKHQAHQGQAIRVRLEALVPVGLGEVVQKRKPSRGVVGRGAEKVSHSPRLRALAFVNAVAQLADEQVVRPVEDPPGGGLAEGVARGQAGQERVLCQEGVFAVVHGRR